MASRTRKIGDSGVRINPWVQIRQIFERVTQGSILHLSRINPFKQNNFWRMRRIDHFIYITVFLRFLRSKNLNLCAKDGYLAYKDQSFKHKLYFISPKCDFSGKKRPKSFFGPYTHFLFDFLSGDRSLN